MLFKFGSFQASLPENYAFYVIQNVEIKEEKVDIKSVITWSEQCNVIHCINLLHKFIAKVHYCLEKSVQWSVFSFLLCCWYKFYYFFC